MYMGYLKKIMDRINKPFESITTLVIIYLGLVTVSVAIYALIQVYVEEKELAASLLSWTATIFATIALIYTFNSWRNQKASEVIANEAKTITEKMNFQLLTHRSLLQTKKYDESYRFHLDNLEQDYRFSERKLEFLGKLIELELSEKEFQVFDMKKKEYLRSYISFMDALATDYMLITNDSKSSEISNTDMC